jgi:hypothetical protein
VERDQIALVRIVLKQRMLPEDCATPASVAQEDARTPARELHCDLVQGEILAGAGRAFDVAQNTSGRRSAIDGRTTRHPDNAVSRRIRKRVEEIFG